MSGFYRASNSHVIPCEWRVEEGGGGEALNREYKLCNPEDPLLSKTKKKIIKI